MRSRAKYRRQLNRRREILAALNMESSKNRKKSSIARRACIRDRSISIGGGGGTKLVGHCVLSLNGGGSCNCWPLVRGGSFYLLRIYRFSINCSLYGNVIRYILIYLGLPWFATWTKMGARSCYHLLQSSFFFCVLRKRKT